MTNLECEAKAMLGDKGCIIRVLNALNAYKTIVYSLLEHIEIEQQLNNNTKLSQEMLNWIRENCENAEYFLTAEPSD